MRSQKFKELRTFVLPPEFRYMEQENTDDIIIKWDANRHKREEESDRVGVSKKTLKNFTPSKSRLSGSLLL